MTPFEIDILMHYFARGGDHAVVRSNPPIWPETRDMFLREGLLAVAEPNDLGATYEITERGTVYARALTTVPLPKQVWVVECVRHGGAGEDE